MWSAKRSALDLQDSGIEHIEVLDEYEEGGAT
jgi:hypothetical protein